MIDVRWPQHHYAHRVGWAGQRLPLLPRLLARAGGDGGGSGGSGGAGSLAGDFVFRRAERLAGADAVGGGVDFDAVVPAAPDAGTVGLGERLVSRASRRAVVIDVTQALAGHARLSSGAGRETPLLAALHARSGTATADFARVPGAPPAIAAGEAAMPAIPLGGRDQGSADIGRLASAVTQRELVATAGGVPGQRVVRRGATSFSVPRAGGNPPTEAAGKPEQEHPDSGSGAGIAVGDTRSLARPAASQVRLARQLMSAAASAAETGAAVDRERFRPEVPPKMPGRDAGVPSPDAVLAGVVRPVVVPVAAGVRRAFDGTGIFADGIDSPGGGKDASARRSLAPGLPSGLPAVGEHQEAMPELAPMSVPVATARDRDLPTAGNGVTRGPSPGILAGEGGELRPVVPAAEPELSSGPGPLAGLMRVRRPARLPAGAAGIDRLPSVAGSQVSPELARGEERLTAAMPGTPTVVMAGVTTGESVADAAFLPQDIPATVSEATPPWPVRRPSLAAMRWSVRPSSMLAADRATASSGAERFARAAMPSAALVAAPEVEGSGSPAPIAFTAGRPPTIDSARTAGQRISPATAGGDARVSRVASSERLSRSAIAGAARPPLAGEASITAFRRPAGRSPALLAPEVATAGGGESGPFVWRWPAAPLPPGSAGRADAVARVASDPQANGLVLAAGATADDAMPASVAPKWADRHSADVHPAPAGTGSATSGDVDWELLVSEVSRRIRRQLMVERERRGWKAWN